MATKIDLNEMYDKIKSIGKMNAGIVTTKQIEEIGIYRGMICKFVNDGRLVKEAKGIYSLADEFPDEYALLQKRSEKIIFSYGTALYLWGMSDRIPHTISVTVPQGFNCTRIKKEFVKIKFHYVKKDIWNLGITNTDTAMGNKVMLYDKERCICDLFKRNDYDYESVIYAIKEYKGYYLNIKKLYEYAKELKVYEKVRNIFEVIGWN